MNQHDFDKKRFSELFSKFTGVEVEKVSDFLKDNNVKNAFEHPTSLSLSNEELRKIEELKEFKNLFSNLKANEKEYKINSSEKAGGYFKEYFSGRKDKELFVCAFLDSQCRLIHAKVMTEGTTNEAAVYAREIAKAALLCDADAVILSHNHPGGSLKASEADKATTKKIANSLAAQGIKIRDHIIVGDENYISFADEGLDHLLGQSYNINENSLSWEDEDEFEM